MVKSKSSMTMATSEPGMVVRIEAQQNQGGGDGLVRGYDPSDPYGIDWDYEGDDAYTETEIDSLVGDYAGEGYRMFKSAMRGTGNVPPNALARAQRLDRWLDAGDYSGEVYRGVNVKADRLDSYQVGATISQRGISSWSTDIEVADAFSSYNDYSRVVFHMSGTSHGRPIWDIPGNNPSEREVTISSQSTQTITARRTRKNGIIDIWLKEE